MKRSSQPYVERSGETAVLKEENGVLHDLLKNGDLVLLGELKRPEGEQERVAQLG